MKMPNTFFKEHRQLPSCDFGRHCYGNGLVNTLYRRLEL
jgi:hypothetical protein